jgi:hypothetical protein
MNALNASRKVSLQVASMLAKEKKVDENTFTAVS